MALLEPIAVSTGPLAERAATTLGYRKQQQYVKSVIAQAQDKKSTYRATMIEALGSIRSPLSYNALSGIVTNADETETARKLAVQVIVRNKDPYAARVLDNLDQSAAAMPAGVRAEIDAAKALLYGALPLNREGK